MKKNELITNLMSKDVKTLQVGQPVSEARKMFANNNFHHLPILEGEKLVGIVSSLDIVKLTFNAAETDDRTMDAVMDSQFTLKDIMQSELVTIGHKDTVRSAVGLLSEGTFHSLPVVDDKNGLVGIVTSTDLIRYLMKQY